MKRKFHRTIMEIERAGTDIDVEIDGVVYYEIKKEWAGGSKIVVEINIIEVRDIDASVDGADDVEFVDLSKEEIEKAKELLKEKFFEGKDLL